MVMAFVIGEFCLQVIKVVNFFCLTSAQQFGEQMQQSNPEMFEQLRTQAQAAVNLHREQQDQSENDDSKPGQYIILSNRVSFHKQSHIDNDILVLYSGFASRRVLLGMLIEFEPQFPYFKTSKFI